MTPLPSKNRNLWLQFTGLPKTEQWKIGKTPGVMSIVHTKLVYLIKWTASVNLKEVFVTVSIKINCGAVHL